MLTTPAFPEARAGTLPFLLLRYLVSFEPRILE